MSKAKPLGLSLTGRPEIWHTCTIDLGEDEPRALRVKYWIYEDHELRQRQRDDIEPLIDNSADDEETRTVGTLRRVLKMLSDERAEENLQELKKRVIDWDMRDAASEDGRSKLPCNAEHIEAACKIKPIFDALMSGLYAASGDRRKKA
jgi:hypothetical protein